MTILNLPCRERYKIKNVFLVGILPGPNKPKHDINDFLRPLVDDLLLLWEKGVTVELPDGVVNQILPSPKHLHTNLEEED